MAASLVNDDEELQRKVRTSIDDIYSSLKPGATTQEQKNAVQGLMDVIIDSTSNVSSIPVAIRFANEQREDLEKQWEQLNDGEPRQCLSDILALLSLMYFQESLLKYLLSGTDKCLSRWGGDFMRNCSIPLARHYKRIKFGRRPNLILKKLGFTNNSEEDDDSDILTSVSRQLAKSEFYMKEIIDTNMKSNNMYDILDMLTEAGLLNEHYDNVDYIEKWLIPILENKPHFIISTAVYLWDLNKHDLARRVLSCIDEGAKRISSALHAAIIVNDYKEVRRLLTLCVNMTATAEANEKDELDEDSDDEKMSGKSGKITLSPLNTYKAWKTELTNCLIYIGQQPDSSIYLDASNIEKIKKLREGNSLIKAFTGATFSGKVEERVTALKLEEPEPMERILAEGKNPKTNTGEIQRQSKIYEILTKLPAASALMDGFANLGMKNDAHFIPVNQKKDDDEFLMTFSSNDNFKLIGGAIEGLLNYGRRCSDPMSALKDCCGCLSSKESSVRAGGFLQLGINLCGYDNNIFLEKGSMKNLDVKKCCLSLLGPYANVFWYNTDRVNVVNWYLRAEPNKDKKYITNLPTLSLFTPPDPNDLSDPYNLAYDTNNCPYPKVSRDEECCAMIALALIYMDTDDKFVKSLLLDKLILVTKHKSPHTYLDKFARSLIPFCLSLVSKCDTYISDAIVRLQVGHSRNQASLKPHPFIAAGLFGLWTKPLPEAEKENHKSKLELAREYCSTIINSVRNISKPDSEREFNSITSTIDVKELDEGSLLRYCAFVEAIVMAAGGCHSDLYEPDGESASMAHFSFLLKSISEATGGRRAAEEEGRRMKDREQNNSNDSAPRKISFPSNRSSNPITKDAEDIESVVIESDFKENPEKSEEMSGKNKHSRENTNRTPSGISPGHNNNMVVHKELWPMKQLDPLTPLVLGLGMTFSAQNGMTILSEEDYKKELNRQHLKSVNSHITPMVARILNKVLLLGTPQCRRAAPLALLFMPKDLSWTLDATDTLTSLLGDSDLLTKLNALFAIGCIHSGTKNPKILRLVRNMLESSNVPTMSFVCRFVLGLVMCGRGCYEISPGRLGTCDSINNGSISIMASLCMIMGVSWNALSTCIGVMLLPLLALCSSLRPLEAEKSEK